MITHDRHPRLRNDMLPPRRSLGGLPPGSPSPAPKAKPSSLVPAPRAYQLWFAHVRRVPGRGWVAECRISRCKFEQTYLTHNGAHSAAARHRREKAHTKMHGATEAAR